MDTDDTSYHENLVDRMTRDIEADRRATANVMAALLGPQMPNRKSRRAKPADPGARKARRQAIKDRQATTRGFIAEAHERRLARSPRHNGGDA